MLVFFNLEPIQYDDIENDSELLSHNQIKTNETNLKKIEEEEGWQFTI